MLQPAIVNKLLDPEERYTFSDFFNLSLATRDVVRGFGWKLAEEKTPLHPIESPNVSFLQRILEVNQRRIPLENEMARRSALISPVLTEVCEITDLRLDTEYGIDVSNHLTGVIDYQIEAPSTLLVVEAKQSDLVRGFRQLVVELIAACYWHQRLRNESITLYGSITDGERWQFARADLDNQTISQDKDIYPLTDLEKLTGTIVAMLMYR